MNDDFMIIRPEDVGQRLDKIKKEQGLSNSQIAKRLSVSTQAVHKWVSGKSIPDVQNLCNLSEMMNVSTDYLLTGNYRDFVSTSNRLFLYAVLCRTFSKKKHN